MMMGPKLWCRSNVANPKRNTTTPPVSIQVQVQAVGYPAEISLVEKHFVNEQYQLLSEIRFHEPHNMLNTKICMQCQFNRLSVKRPMVGVILNNEIEFFMLFVIFPFLPPRGRRVTLETSSVIGHRRSQ